MNVVFATMGAMYQVYYDAYIELKDKVDNVGFYVSDSFNFKRNVRNNDISYLKEWELIEKIKTTKLDYEKIRQYEAKYFKDESIWHSLNNDRRIFFGKYVKHTQDYSPYYCYEDMLKLFQVFIESIEQFIDDVKPNIIFGITPATLGDYLFYKVAIGNGIVYYSLKTVKVGNYQTFTKSIQEEHNHIKQTFNDYLNGITIDEVIINETKKYLNNFKKGSTAYEGNVAIPKNYKIFKLQDLIRLSKSLAKDIFLLSMKKDHHSRGLNVLKFLYDYPIKSYRANKFKSYTLNRTISKLSDIESYNYIFFPLHAEPEIAITNYARFYQNQIEVIRNISLQLPANYKLLIKEHPRNIGRRTLGYYKKILEIPNVDFADFELPSIEVIKHSKLVIVLSGNIGFEAVLLNVPVISMGSALYNMLPSTMVNYVDNIKYLHHEIEKTINEHNPSDEIVEKFISAIIKNSFKLDLYTVLLRKSGREGGSEFDNQKYITNIQHLANEISNKISEL